MRADSPAAAPAAPVAEKTEELLQSISEEGGFAFVNSAEKAAAGDFRAAEAAREMAWEQLHSGPWHSVVPAWRDAYAMTCLYLAGFHAKAGEFRDALKVLDMGLIMGGLLFRKDLEELVKEFMERSKEEGGSSGVGEICLGVGEEKVRTIMLLGVLSRNLGLKNKFVRSTMIRIKRLIGKICICVLFYGGNFIIP